LRKIVLIFIAFTALAAISLSCAKSRHITITEPVDYTSTAVANITQTAVYLQTAGPAAQATATAQIQATQTQGAVLTLTATWFVPTNTPTKIPTVTKTPTVTPTLPPHLIISGSVGGMQVCAVSTMTSCFPVTPQPAVYISDRATPVHNATVSLNGTPMPYSNDNGSDGVYTCTPFPAATYTLLVTYNGKTYSGSAADPGGYADLANDQMSAT
jgi:hypothetical protein